MASGDGAIAEVSRHDLRWKWLLLVLWALGLLLTFAWAGDVFGLGGRPWFGYWDAVVTPAHRPYVVEVVQPLANGASAQAGLHDGDTADLRELSADARIELVSQLMATRPTALVMHRGPHTFTASVTGSTVREGRPLWKLPSPILIVVANTGFLLCALLIAMRRWYTREGRILALVLLCMVSASISPFIFVVPNAKVSLLLDVSSSAFGLVAALLLVGLSSSFGIRYPWRRFVEGFAYAANIASFLSVVAVAVGLLTLWIDPLPNLFGGPWKILDGVAIGAVVLAAVTAVASTPRSQRPRTAWLLLPLPIAYAVSNLFLIAVRFTESWYVLIGVGIVADALMLLGALTVTYALLKRTVLDLEFVLSRTLVVAIVSLIVLTAFVLLEWALTAVLVSHTTGVIANALLALGLGISLSFIHKRVDTFVDSVFFRKRYEDARALRDFSQEAAFATSRAALLDQALENVRAHTDARAAALYLRKNGAYKAVRSFGDTTAEAGENDPAILALMAWRKPLDPHRYATALRGALVLPILGRGQLVGLLLCGQRIGGEAYAPDEVDALVEFTHGIGSALDALSTDGDGSHDELLRAIQALSDLIRALPNAIVERLRGMSVD